MKISTTNDTRSWILDAGYWVLVLGTGHWVLGYWIRDIRYWILNFGPLTLNVDKLVKRQIFDFYSLQHIEIKSLIITLLRFLRLFAAISRLENETI